MAAEVTDVEVYVLGEPHLRIDGHTRPFPAGRPGRLLASLLTTARSRCSSDTWSVAHRSPFSMLGTVGGDDDATAEVSGVR